MVLHPGETAVLPAAVSIESTQTFGTQPAIKHTRSKTSRAIRALLTAGAIAGGLWALQEPEGRISVQHVEHEQPKRFDDMSDGNILGLRFVVDGISADDMHEAGFYDVIPNPEQPKKKSLRLNVDGAVLAYPETIPIIDEKLDDVITGISKRGTNIVFHCTTGTTCSIPASEIAIIAAELEASGGTKCSPILSYELDKKKHHRLVLIVVPDKGTFNVRFRVDHPPGGKVMQAKLN